jgi:hypothetical protein
MAILLVEQYYDFASCSPTSTSRWSAARSSRAARQGDMERDGVRGLLAV